MASLEQEQRQVGDKQEQVKTMVDRVKSEQRSVQGNLSKLQRNELSLKQVYCTMCTLVNVTVSAKTHLVCTSMRFEKKKNEIMHAEKKKCTSFPVMIHYSEKPD